MKIVIIETLFFTWKFNQKNNEHWKISFEIKMNCETDSYLH